MKIKLNRALRRALYASLCAIWTTTLGTTTLTTVGLVSISLLAQEAQAEVFTFVTPETSGADQARLEGLTASDTLIFDTSIEATYLPVPPNGGSMTIDTPVYIKNFALSGFSTGRGYIFTGSVSDFKHYTGDGADPTAPVGSIQLVVGTDNLNRINPLNFTFSGVMSGYSGNIESKMDGANFTFSTASGVDLAARNASASGTGALIVGGRQVTYNMSGDVTVDNSSITVSNTIEGHAVTAAGAALNTGLNFTGGATYSVSGPVVADNLSVMAGTTAHFANTLVSASSQTIHGAVTVAGADNLFAGMATIADGASLSVTGDLTIGGRLRLAESITGSGSVSFLDSALIDLSQLAFTSDGSVSIYQIHDGGTTDFGVLSLENLTGIAGLSRSNYSASFDNATGSILLEALVAQLGYAGSADVNAPAQLAWSNNEEAVFTSGGEQAAYVEGAIVSFAADTHTHATLEGGDTIEASAVHLEQGASLILGSDATVLELSSFNLAADASLTVDGNFLTGPEGALIAVTGETSSELRLNMSLQILSSDLFDFSDYAGSLTLESGMRMNVDTAASLGSISQITVEQGAILSYAGGITPNMSVVRGSGTLELNASTSYGDGTHLDFAGDIVVNAGTLTFGAEDGNTARLAAASVTLNSGTSFTIYHAGADFTGTDLNMNGAMLYGGDIGLNSNGGIRLGQLTVSGSNTIAYQWNGVFSFTGLTGEGLLNFNASAEAGELHFLGVTDFNGTLNFGTGGTDDKILISGIVEQSAGQLMQLSGRVIETQDVLFRGEGTVTFSSGLKSGGNAKLLDGTLNVNDFQFAAAGDSMTLLGGTFNITSATMDSALDGDFFVGAATIGSSEADMTIADDMKLGATYAVGLPEEYEPSPGAPPEDPIVTTIQTTQSDSVYATHITISGDIADDGNSSGALQLVGAGSLTLSGDNSFSGGVRVGTSSLILASSTAAGTGAISLDGGSLDVGGQAIRNTIDYRSGSISGMGAFAGHLNVHAGALSLSDTAGSMSVASGASLTLTGAWDFSSAIVNEGSLIFDASMTLDLTGAVFTNNGSGSYELSIVTGAGSLTDDAWLTAGELDMSKVSGLLTQGRAYSYSNGVLSYTLTGASLTYTGNSDAASPETMSWVAGALFDGESPFSQHDRVTFSAATGATLGEDIAVATLDLNASASLDVEGGYRLTAGTAALADDARLFVRDGAQFSAESLSIGAGAYVYINGDLDVQVVTLAEGSGNGAVLGLAGSLGSAHITAQSRAIVIASDLGSATVELLGTAEMRFTETFDVGELTLDGIIGGDDSSIRIDLAESGTVLSTPNFTGTLQIGSGMMESTMDQIESFAGVQLGADTTLNMSGMIGAMGYDLSHVSGEATSTLRFTGTGADAASTQLNLAEGFAGTLLIHDGVLDVFTSDLGGSSAIVLDSAGLTFDNAITPDGVASLGVAVSISDGTTAILQAVESTTGRLTAAVSGAADTTINKSGAGTIELHDLTGFAGTVNIQEGHLVIGSDATLAGLGLTAGQSIEVAAGGHTVSVSADTLYTRHAGNDTIIVGTDSTLEDNVYLRLQTGTITISGGGTYEITKFMGADYSATQSKINIAADTTLRVTHDVTSGDSTVGAAFMMGHWGAGANTEVNVAGTLDLNSGLSNKDGTGVINVEEGGNLILRKGLYAVDADSETAALSIYAASGASVQLYNQANATATGVLIADFAGGSTIQAMDATTAITSTMRLSGTGDVTLSMGDSATTVNVNGAITAAAGSSAGLAITGTSAQTVNLNAANSYAGDTSITGARVVAGHAQAFGATGSITVHSGSLDLNDLAVSNHITAAGGSLEGFSAYTGSLHVTGSVSGTDLRSTMSVADSASLTLSGTWFYDSAIANAGTVSFDSSLELDLSDASFTYSGGVYSLDLMTGSGSLDASSWLTAEGAVDLSKLTGILTDTRSFSYDAGVLSYTSTSKNLIWAGGDGSWSAEAGNTGWFDGASASGYTSRDHVTFATSSTTENTILLVGELNPLQVIVDSAQNYSFEGTGSLAGDTQLIKEGSGTLTLTRQSSHTGGTTLAEGTLRIQNMNALGTGELEITGGILSLYGGGDVTIENLNLSAGVLNIALEDTDGTLYSGMSIERHALTVSGTGSFTHDEWSKISSVDVGAGASVHFSDTNGYSTEYKVISGEGNISVANTTEWLLRTQFDASNHFSGTFSLADSGRAVMDIDHSSADHRSALALGASSKLVFTSDSAATLYLDGLSGSGEIRYDWSPTVTRHIDLEISTDQEFAGSFYHNNGARMGNVTVGSVEGEHHTFTFSGVGMSTNDTRASNGNLIIESATVAMTKDAVWNGGIQLSSADSVLRFAGNATTRAAEAGAISGLGSVQVQADTTLNGANSYSGTTTISAGTLTVGNASALGTSTVTVDGGTLNLGGLAVSNDVTAAGGSLAGFSAYAGDLSVTGNVSVADTITGNLSISDTGTLNLSGTWDFSSVMSNDGMLNVSDSLILDLSGSSFDADNSFVLFTGTGSSNIDSWLTANSAELSSHLLGVDTEGKTFSYSNGVLSYTLPSGDIHIGMNENESLTAGLTQSVIFDDASGIAQLGHGFTQGEGTSFSGAGTILIEDASTATLDKASADFSGTVRVGEHAQLNIAGADVLGSSEVKATTGSSIIISEGASLTNKTALAATASIQAGDLSITGQRTGLGSLAGDDLAVTHDVDGVGRISDTALTSVAVHLETDGVGFITESTLTSTAVTLGDGSELTLQGVTLGLGSTITNDSATLNLVGDNEIVVATGNGLSEGRIVTGLKTLEGGTHDMLVYTLTSISVETFNISGTLTLDITLSGADLLAFEEAYYTLGGVVAFELDGVSEAEFATDYTNVTLHIKGGLEPLTLDALGYTLVGGNIALYIPEPSTATLSLLALAGLLMRRRREQEV